MVTLVTNNDMSGNDDMLLHCADDKCGPGSSTRSSLLSMMTEQVISAQCDEIRLHSLTCNKQRLCLDSLQAQHLLLREITVLFAGVFGFLGGYID